MKVKHFIKLTLVFALALPMMSISSNEAYADEFTGKEDTYYQLCSSKKLTKGQRKTCESFNAYLKKKSTSIKQNISDGQSEISKTKDSISDMQTKIGQLSSQISTTQSQINYVQNSINNTEQDLKEKQEKLKERIYAIQSTTNSTSYVSYLFGAEDFSDFFSRVATVGEPDTANDL